MISAESYLIARLRMPNVAQNGARICLLKTCMATRAFLPQSGTCSNGITTCDPAHFEASIFNQMQRPSSLNDGRQIGYGLGLFLEKVRGVQQISHAGATAGYRAWLGQIPVK